MKECTRLSAILYESKKKDKRYTINIATVQNCFLLHFSSLFSTKRMHEIGNSAIRWAPATYSYLQFYRLCSSYAPHIFVLFQGTTWNLI